MIRHFRILCLWLVLGLAASLQAQPSTPAVTTRPATNDASAHPAAKPEKPWKPITAGPADGRIAFVTATLLEEVDYLHRRFDHNLSSEFFDRYLSMLDPQHLHFIQSDLDEFEKYRTNLDELTLQPDGVGDPTPAFVIFNRFMERLIQRTAYAESLLKTEKFDFTTDEHVAANRKDAAYPADLTAARELWRQNLRREYLLEKLARANATNASTTVTLAGTNASAKPKGPPKTESEEIVDTLTHNYDRTLRLFKDLTGDEVLETYLTALAHVYDPHSDYMDQEQYDSFNITMNLELFGIGAELHSEDGFCSILSLVPGGPAIKSQQLHENDRIVAVAQGDKTPVDVVGMNLTKIVQMIRGPKGTEVRLTIVPLGDESAPKKVVTLIRDKIKLEDKAATGQIIDLPAANGRSFRLGVIDLPSFYGTMDASELASENGGGSTITTLGASADVARLLKKFNDEKVEGVILDLRHNGGGLLGEAVKLTGLFIKTGPVVQVRKPGRGVTVDGDDDPSVTYDGPLVVLTSHFSASASEIVAAALQDYGRALEVGDMSTFGKGTVQQIAEIKPYMRPGIDPTNDPGALKVTVQKFYRVSGDSTELKGVSPDIVLPSIWSFRDDVGEKALENPLEFDTVTNVAHDQFNLVRPYLATLLRRSSERVATNQEFAYIREDIEEVKKEQNAKTISLNLAERLKELQDRNARDKARDQERMARKTPDVKVYEITLKDAGLPGLPPPLAKTNSPAAHLAAVGGLPGPSGATGTNAAIASAGSTGGSTPSVSPADADEDTPPKVDATLDETEHILQDYVQLLGKGDSLAAGTTPGTSGVQ